MGTSEVTEASTVTEASAVTEGVGEAPVTESSESVALPPAAAADAGASSSEASVASVESNQESSQESSPFPTADSFGWDAWDGTTDALPELVRTWGQKIYDHRQGWVDKEMKAREAETQRLQEIYSGLLDGIEDPRVAETSSALEKLQAKFDALEKSSSVTASEYEEYKAAMQKAVDEEAEAIATGFRAAHPEFFEDKAKLTLFGELLEEDWDLEAIPKVMALSGAARAVARQARVAGTPDKFALQLAGNTVSKPAAPRPGARITSGATGSAPSPHRAVAGAGDAKTFDDVRNNAVTRALRSVRGGKR